MERNLEELHEKLKCEIISRIDDGSGRKVNLRDEDNFKELGFDSLDMTEYIMRCEEEYGLTFDDNRLDEIKTVKDFISYFDELYLNK